MIGGAGSIGSGFKKVMLRFEPKSVMVVDFNENGLAELVSDVRSTEGRYNAHRSNHRLCLRWWSIERLVWELILLDDHF